MSTAEAILWVVLVGVPWTVVIAAVGAWLALREAEQDKR
jgi:hypothetical protein